MSVPLPSPPAPLEQGAVVLYLLVQSLLVAYSCHRYVVLARWWRGLRAPAGRRTGATSNTREPRITVQVPIYNERRVVERSIAAVAALDWPRERLEIQILDDSTDDTRELAAAAVARLRGLGVPIAHLHRAERRGFKAGALALGLRRSRGDLVAVFDADFLPARDFLRRIVPHFAEPDVGMVQARWGHLNRGRSRLTSAQAVMLDAHFMLEHQSRMGAGLFFNFNGAAGVWRRACVESAGGWSHDTLTEDLDLSYRAQLAGWRFVFVSAIEAPAELPADMEALKSQQRRWAKGSIQTARKLLPALLRSALPMRIKLEAFVHLTGNVAYPLLLGLALLLLPVLLARTPGPHWVAWLVQGAVIAFGVLPVVAFLAAGQRAARLGKAGLGDVGAALVLGMGLSLNNARAVLEGFGRGTGVWERTPKTGDGGPAARPVPAYQAGGRLRGWPELGLALYLVAVGGIAWAQGQYRVLPFVALLVAGFAWVGAGSSSRRAKPIRGG